MTMKQLLLLTALMLGCSFAQAGDLDNCDRHEGLESSFYSTQVIVNDNGVPTYFAGKAMRVCSDSENNKMYIHNPFCIPTSNVVASQGVVEGTIEDGYLSIPLHQVTYTYEDPEIGTRYWKVDVCTITSDPVDEYYTRYIIEPIEDATEYRMIIDPVTGVISSEQQDIYLCEYEAKSDGNRIYDFSFGGNYVMTPYEPSSIVIPEGAQYERYIYDYTLDGVEKSQVVDVAFYEDSIYAEGLLVEDMWIVGHIADGKATFKTDQKLGIYNEQFVEYVSGKYLGKNFVTEAEEYDTAEAFVFNISEDKKELTYADEDIVLMLTNGSQLMKVVKKCNLTYFNEIPATPAMPVLIDASIDPTFGGIKFDILSEDVDGNFINPENITYSIFLDGDLYEFLPELYYVEEPISEFPYGYNDYVGGMEIYSDGSTHSVTIYGELYETIGVEVYYTVQGERRASERLIYGGDNSVENIENTKTIVESYYYDLNGRRVVEPENGIYIKANKYDDGSIQHTKTIVNNR